MKKTILMVVAAISTQYAMAQNVSFEAYKIADVFMKSSGQTLTVMMPLLAQKLESEFLGKGVSADSAKRFGSELKGLGPADFTKAYAVHVSENYSADEQRTLLNFLDSEVGRKYVASLNPESSMAQAIGQSLFREACKRAKLTSRDIQGVC